MSLSQFWKSGGRRTLAKEWAAKDRSLRAEHWRGQQPSDFISFRAYQKLPAKRRQAIEQAAYRRGIE